MRPLFPIRTLVPLAGVALCAMLLAAHVSQAQAHPTTPPPSQNTFSGHPQQEQPQAGADRTHPGSSPRLGPGNKPSGEHLSEWMSRHNTLTPGEQLKALETEPGFRELPPTTQQRMRERLAQLNAMSPEKRQHLLDRNEAMEHLTVPQREQVRQAMKQLSELPPDQRRYVARTFRGLRELPPAQRQSVLSSERFSHLTDAQRASLNSLMQVEPLLPPPYDAGPPPNQQ